MKSELTNVNNPIRKLNASDCFVFLESVFSTNPPDGITGYGLGDAKFFYVRVTNYLYRVVRPHPILKAS